MLTGNLILVIAIAGFIAILTLIHFILAFRHDHEIAAAPRYRTLEVLDEEIQRKENTRIDLEEELEKRRAALAVVADIRAEVDALERKRDELNIEWQQLDERRNEVRQLRLETEESLNEKLNVDSDLQQIKEEYELVQERLARAERLFSEIDAMKQEKIELETDLIDLRDEFIELTSAKEKLAELETQANEIKQAIVTLETQLKDSEQQALIMSERASAERENLAEAQSKNTEASSQLAALRQAALDLEAICASREARRARLDEEIGESSGGSGINEKEVVEERLKELKTIPPVLINMRDWPLGSPQDEGEALHGMFNRLEQSGLKYPARAVHAFHTSMKVNETTQMAVLAGISGTGKSQLPRQYALGMGIGFLQVPVQPRWDSPQDLMGFYNYIEKRFRPTDMARALYQLDILNNPGSDFNDHMMMILLDEMNLARVEYYFSDFLSRLESRPPKDQVEDPNLRKDAEIELEIPMPKGMDTPRVFPGYNLLFAGTMNEDESTQSLSDKVVDRANVLRFAAPKQIHSKGNTEDLPQPKALPKSKWDSWVRPVSTVENNSVITDALNEMVHTMKEFKRPFGHRLGRAIMSYVANYPNLYGSDKIMDPLADQVEMRLLPKLRGIEIDQAEQTFERLQEYVAGKLGDEELARAIKEAVDAAKDSGTGQFVWHGATRE